VGLGATEVWFRHIEPKVTREELRAWRLSVRLEEFRAIGKKYDDAGIDKIAFTHDMKDDFTDEELERPFLMGRPLRAERIATSTTLTVARRLAPLMEKHQMEVAVHGHINTADPNEFAGPDSFRKALAMSPLARINLDIGQFVGAGFDPVPFIAEQHAKIPVLHIRDGQRGQRGKVPWGMGDVPIKAVLQLLKRERYKIVADIEYDYGGATDPANQVKKCFAYCRDALE
jgi:sugar phosphate isomerase/epimerase